MLIPAFPNASPTSASPPGVSGTDTARSVAIVPSPSL